LGGEILILELSYRSPKGTKPAVSSPLESFSPYVGGENCWIAEGDPVGALSIRENLDNAPKNRESRITVDLGRVAPFH
jgi:hypothetical protein